MVIHVPVEQEKVISGLAGFFDLLAQFDYEDHKKLSGLKPAPSDSAPEGAGLVSVENTRADYGKN